MRDLKNNLIFAGIISALSILMWYVMTLTIFGINQAVNGYCENIFILAFDEIKRMAIIIVIINLIVAICRTIPFIDLQFETNARLNEILTLLVIFFSVVLAGMIILGIYTNSLC